MTLFERLRRRPAPLPTSATPTADVSQAGRDLPEDFVAFVTGLVHAGFRSRGDVLEEAHDWASQVDVEPGVVDDYVAAVWRARVEAQRTWPAVTDADRLEAAFAELDASGIVARMDFTCCQTCGMAEIGAEVLPGQSPSGYVYFHQQDSDGLAKDDATLFLSFGAFGAGEDGNDETASLAVGHQVRASLERAGLTVSWPGTTQQRIQVTGLSWRRRLPI